MRAPILLAACLATPALASSPSAWAKGDRAAVKACLAASGLRDGRASERVLFGDATGRTAMLVRGRWPRRHMGGGPGVMLCLYDRRTRTAEAAEAKGWSAP